MKQTSLPSPLLAVALALGLAACGAGSVATSSGDGGGGGGGAGGDGGAPEVAAVVGRRSFDVVATLSPMGAGARTSLPATNVFTLVLDTDTRQVVVGGNGEGQALPYTTLDGRTFLMPEFSVGIAGSSCFGLSSFHYAPFQFTVDGTTLRGHTSGSAVISDGDTQSTVPLTADLTGVADGTPPLLLPTQGAPTTPFDGIFLVASEPLTASSTAHLTADDGTSIDLVPSLVDGALPLVTAFAKPDLVLPYGKGLAVSFEGLVDFAGHQGSAAAPLRLAMFATPPLVPADGFENATGAQFGGGAVITGGQLPPIAGTRSVYIGGTGAPSPGAVGSASLFVRLAVPSGATKLRFSYQLTSISMGGGAAKVELGSVGHKAAYGSVGESPDAPKSVAVMWTGPTGSTLVYVTPVADADIALPTEVTDELVVAITTGGFFGCGPPFAPSGVLIDDLRVE